MKNDGFICWWNGTQIPISDLEIYKKKDLTLQDVFSIVNHDYYDKKYEIGTFSWTEKTYRRSDPSESMNKDAWGYFGLKFLRQVVKLSGHKPSKKYPRFNESGWASWGEHYLEYQREDKVRLLFALCDQYSYWKIEGYPRETEKLPSGRIVDLKSKNRFERIDVEKMTNEEILQIIDDFMKGKI